MRTSDVEEPSDMILSTSETIAGREITETIGLVRGNSARARGLGYDITAGFRNIFGGAVPEYSKLITETRDEATANMIAAAQAQGADAIVAVRYTTSMISTGVSEILAFGTAVKLR
jgi:uncharacterized protein YbjQ (UPF0145 family)